MHHVATTADRNLGTLLGVWDRVLGRLETRPVPADAVLGNGDRDYPQAFVRCCGGRSSHGASESVFLPAAVARTPTVSGFS